ncbi:hypothetical protein [Kribbella italica]|uniref:Phage tail tape measure protein n=1 Tax=Kribbella italica TaxID=1540520 RepID=A0A7W9J9P9_9ACTN|nr:hypothetical protein [Kribbella italica]MBB5837747.1 hypothetical protein [Kribbella italica]
MNKMAGGLGKGVAGIGKGFGIAGVAVGALGGGLLVAGKQIFNMAGQLELMGKKAKVVFGDQLPQVEGWASRTAHSMGLTTREAVGLAAGFADLLIPMGFTRKQAADMSTDVIGLSGALAEWSGGTRTAAEVSDILNAAMLGERDALQGLGISISQAEVDAALLAKGQENLTGKARQQAEATATLGLVMDKSKDAQKAFADGAGSLARKNAENSARLKEMGQALLTTATPALIKIGEAISKHVLPVAERFVTWVSGPGKYAIADWALSGAQWVLNFADQFLAGLETITRFIGKWGKALLRSMAVTMAPFNAGLAKSMWDASNSVGDFADSTLTSLGNARAGIKTTEDKIKNAKLVAKLSADKASLDQKLRDARNALNDPSLTKERRARLNAEIVQLQRQVNAAQSKINSLRGKTVTITARAIAIVSKQYEAVTSGRLDYFGSSISGARAAGGPVSAGRSYLVGERGPEIVTMGGNGNVTPNHALGGDTYVYVTIDGQQLQGRIDRTVREGNRQTRRAVGSGAKRGAY